MEGNAAGNGGGGGDGGDGGRRAEGKEGEEKNGCVSDGCAEGTGAHAAPLHVCLFNRKCGPTLD